MSFSIECIDCGLVKSYHPNEFNCPNCQGQWRKAIYDYEKLAKTLPGLLEKRPFDLWRYLELLPIYTPVPSLRMGEGGTPLIQAVNLGMMLGCPNIFIKDERQGPSASFKDRQAAVTIAALKEAGITEMVAASTGNVAISYSAFAARAGIKLWAFVTSLVPAVKMREIALYGSQVVKVTGSYDQVKKIAAEFAEQRGLYHDMGARTITSVEGMKTIAYEIAEQLTDQLGPPEDGSHWRTPTWYIQAISGGLGPIGISKGFHEMQMMGFTNQVPAIAAIQADGCAPMVHAWKQNLEEAAPVINPKTHIETLATGTPGRAYPLLRKELKENSGVFESVTDEEAFRAMHVLAKMEGISAEPASAAGFAGLFKLIRAGIIKPTDTVVVNCTGHTMPAEPLVLGSGWARNVVLPQESESSGADSAAAPKEGEGLLAALSRVAPDRFPRVAIADDTPDARRLIRRILQSQGEYTIFEASNGREALEVVQREHPDLLILDLMMPEMDGFAVLDALKNDPETAHIPVIVSTAKELTKDEKDLLQGQIQALMQKGDFMSDEFLEEVKSLIR
ncbi:MAG: pyridoxal-phosphate dependent enzyme [Anaerolineales bacterium]|jgi:threonine synthase|nr:pyridoxal-phosphate dependent enzyme [Anaerolineales bacterium]